MPCLSVVECPALDASCLRIHRFSTRKTIHLLALLATLPVIAPAAVTNYIWDGNAPNGNGNRRWSSAVNWAATNTVPPANNVRGLTNSDITFAGSLKLSPSMQNPYFIRSLVFDPTAGAFTLTAPGSTVLTIGAGGIVNQSANTQTIVNNLSLSNSQTWNASAGNLVVRGSVNLGANALTVAGAANVFQTNVIQGSGRIIKQGTGNLTLAGTGANVFSGGTTLDAGNITVAKVNALGSGPLTVNSGSLNLGSFNQTVGVFTMNGGSVVGTTAILTASAYQINSGTVNVRLGGNAPLVKSGSGTTTVTTPNVFNGGTIVNGGTLAINNTTGSGTGTGNVAVNSGGKLMGTGTVAGMITNGPGGTISAGSSVGLFNTGTQFWLGGSTNQWEISDAAGTAGVGWDLLNISGALNILATASNKTSLDVISFTLGGVPGQATNFDPAQSYLWTIAQTSGGVTFLAGQDVTSAFDLRVGGFANPLNGGAFDLALSSDGAQLNLVYTPAIIVPEPDKLSFAALAVCGYIYGRRFKQNWRSEYRPARRKDPQSSSTATAAA